MKIGLISDTHGLLRSEAIAALANVDHILHAGDVGDPSILATLAKLAPISAIRGNIDRTGPCAKLPATEMIELGGFFFYMVHDVHDLDLDPTAAGVHVVVSGHSHRPSIEQRKGVLYVNPGSAGPRRFSLPISVGIMQLGNELPEAHILPLTLPG
jgi:putative phosphoesterase